MAKPEELVQLVFFVRGEKVMFDADLARLYGVTTKALNQAIVAKQIALSGRLRLSAEPNRIGEPKVTNCDHIR